MLFRSIIRNPDYEVLRRRNIDALSAEERNQFQNAIRIYTMNFQVERMNKNVLRQQQLPAVEIKAINIQRDAQDNILYNTPLSIEMSPSKMQGLQPILHLSIGCRVMLRINLWTKKNLVNGAIGTVRDIVYKPNQRPPQNNPYVIIVHFPGYIGPQLLEQDAKIVPIFMHTKSVRKDNYRLTRQQFPLQLAYCITAHKSQSLQFDRAIVHLGREEKHLGSTYVALSRVHALQGLAFAHPLDFERLKEIKSNYTYKHRIETWRLLQNDQARQTALTQLNLPRMDPLNRPNQQR